MSAPPPFFELGARTNFSFLEGASSAEEMVAAAAAIGLSGIGIADRNTVAGVVRAHAKAKAENYPFRAGARLVFADGTPDILAYPQNREGWAHLCRLLSAGNLRSVKGDCTLHEDDLLEWSGALMLAVLPDRRSDSRMETLPAFLDRLRQHVGDRAYLGLARHYDGFDDVFLETLASVARGLRIPLLATSDALYHDGTRRPLADVVTAIREHATVTSAGFRLGANSERHLKDPAEIARMFRSYPQAIANSREFFDRLGFSLEELQYQYPDESMPGETPQQTLRRLTLEGAKWRYPEGTPQKVADQIEYELSLISRKRYEPYFLTVRHIMEFARSEKILCQGRGSAANSTVCFCLGITEVDPATTTLLFDRFISIDRDEPPDIDVDFEHEKRETVIQYIYRRYGHQHAGLAAAVTSYRARSAGREVSKAFGLSEDVQSALSGAVWGWSTSSLTEREASAAGLDMTNPTTRRVLEYSAMLMGFPRHLTQHVGGFIITRDRLDEVVPIMNTAMKDRYMVEWDKDDLDTLKILKIDVLALGMLTCLAKAFSLLEEHYNVPKNLAALYREQENAVYDMICRADTIGVFQIESRAQMSMLPRLRPQKFYDLVIEVAIVRPGPIQGNMVHPYLKRRQEMARNKKVDYPSPELEDVLKRTLGVPLFQEQAMQIAITAAGFTPSEADQLRRAMATFRRTGTIGSFRQKMIDGMVAKKYPREFAERCFSQIEGFGEYGFPESHAASFALLVYASSWFKTYYPDVFCAAILNSQPMGFYAPAQLVRDAREHGVRVLPVDVNHSSADCTLEAGAHDKASMEPRHRDMRDVIRTERSVRLGFRLVKGLAAAEVEKLVANRGTGYRSVRDLWLRSGLARASVERLADADAFRSMGLDRRKALWAAKALDEGRSAETLPLFAEAGDAGILQKEPDVHLPPMLPGEQVVHDYRYLSLSLKAHPVSFLREKFSMLGIAAHRTLETAPVGRRISVAGLVLVRQRPGSAKGVIFMTIEDETGVANIIVWPKAFEAFRPIVMGARLVKVTGRLQREQGVIHIVADRLEDMTALLATLQAGKDDLIALAHGDEVRRPVQEMRHKVVPPRATGDAAQGRASVLHLPDRTQDLAREAARVMPKGRNFH
ncbi:error-prone DNA polymerase [Sinorhizobium sp. BG8]|uniref:error-prone DNA polymerase n=1 Tax=Sinorhizobium sp. BG8 TaxID=2613773 RepID=UPI00193EA986|nr:error-prone DNA polymerase [Sinorhizobium sp. BG8]QRM53551.1 DNA polymerase III subunit alpha [Sinorhizobium sp. BG8]